MSAGRIVSVIGTCVVAIAAGVVAMLNVVGSQAAGPSSFVGALLWYGVSWFVLFGAAAAVIAAAGAPGPFTPRPIWENAVAFGAGGAITGALMATLFWGLVSQAPFLARSAFSWPFVLPWAFGLIVRRRLDARRLSSERGWRRRALKRQERLPV